MFRQPLKIVSKLKSQRRFLSDIDKPSLDEIRSKEAKGAMKDFIQKTATGSGEGGLWSRLRQDIAPPPMIETVKPVSNLRSFNKNSRPYGQSSNDVDGDDDDNEDEEQRGQPRFKDRKPGFNNAPKAKNAGFVKRPATTSTPAYAGAGGGGGFGAARRAKLQEEEEEAYLRGENNDLAADDFEMYGSGDKPVDLSEFDPEELDALFDADKEAANIRSGKLSYPIHEMDMLDSFFMNGYMESMKTDDGMYIQAEEYKKLKTKKMPKPRSMSQMVYSMKPNIRGAELGSAGHIIGEQAWNIVSRNFYYNEAQKYEVTDLIAAKENALREYTSTQGVIRKVEDTPYPPCDYDGIFEYGFRKGEDYMEDQAHMMAMEDDVVVVNPYIQGPTDWSVQAVEDEDQL